MSVSSPNPVPSAPPRTTARSQIPLWYGLIVVWLIVGITMGRAQSMGLYLPSITAALDIGRETFSLSLAITFLLMGIGAPFTGALIDRFGAGRVVALCLLATVGGIYLLYIAKDGTALIVSGVLMGIGVSGTGITPMVGTIGRLAPPEKRLGAIASIGMAAGVGSFVALPVMHLLIETLGWEQSLLWLMAIIGVLAPLALSLGGRTQEVGGNQTIKPQSIGEALREAARLPSYWLLTAGFFVCGFHVSFMVVHLPAFTVDQGLPTWVGPYALSAVGITNLIGTYIAGQSGRFISKRHALSLIYFGRAVIFLGFLYLPITATNVLIMCALLGLLWLATVPLTSGLVATFFGTTWMSMLFGIVFLSHQIGSFIGVWLAGWLFDQTRSYDAMWYISIALGVLSALLNWPIKERPVARITQAQAAAGGATAGLGPPIGQPGAQAAKV